MLDVALMAAIFSPAVPINRNHLTAVLTGDIVVCFPLHFLRVVIPPGMAALIAAEFFPFSLRQLCDFLPAPKAQVVIYLWFFSLRYMVSSADGFDRIQIHIHLGGNLPVGHSISSICQHLFFPSVSHFHFLLFFARRQCLCFFLFLHGLFCRRWSFFLL